MIQEPTPKDMEFCDVHDKQFKELYFKEAQ